jgi:hypothetical protein
MILDLGEDIAVLGGHEILFRFEGLGEILHMTCIRFHRDLVKTRKKDLWISKWVREIGEIKGYYFAIRYR